MPFAAIAMSITAAAKIELFTYLACQAHKPVYNPDQGGDPGDVVSLVGKHVISYLAGVIHTIASRCWGPDARTRTKPESVRAGSCRASCSREARDDYDHVHGHLDMHDDRMVGLGTSLDHCAQHVCLLLTLHSSRLALGPIWSHASPQLCGRWGTNNGLEFSLRLLVLQLYSWGILVPRRWPGAGRIPWR